MADPALDGHSNMARDLALAERAECEVLAARSYSWNGAWVSLGKFQNAANDLVDPCIDYVIRPTGGKAVLHGHDVTLGLALPLDAIECMEREVKKAYRAIAKPVIEALVACGVDAVLAEETRFTSSGPRTADCFAFNSPNDIIDRASGKKICGCALRLSGGVVLLQASIPVGAPRIDPRAVIRRASDCAGPNWRSDQFGESLEAALRYNFSHV